MAAARALSHFFGRVTIVERDELAFTEERPRQVPLTRRGVPQGAHLHGLLYVARTTFDELFDTFTDEMLAVPTPFFDMCRHQALLLPEGWIARAPGDFRVTFATRWTTEWVVRTLVKNVPNIAFTVGQVIGLATAGEGKRVTGVVALTDESERILEADLVVDASGRGSRAPQWFEEIGYAPPVETTVKSYLGYATTYCHLPEDAWPGDLRSITAPPIPGFTRGGSINPQEDGIVGVIAVGQARDYPPRDRKGFAEFLKTGVTPVIYDMWQRAEQICDISTTRTSTNQLRRWHELADRPERFIALGDAYAAFNPVYGQGITNAALSAKRLRDLLREHPLDKAIEMLPQQLFEVSAFPWSTATMNDLAFEATETENLDAPPPKEAVEYFTQVRRLATEDPYVGGMMFRAIGTQDPGLLFQESVMRRVTARAGLPDGPAPDFTAPPLYSLDRTPLAEDAA
ncbi:hypothetical protein A5695_20050 [Mycobacterium sp. E1747]|nr:hypothetical protein A5695_20050 [Mycobacterium sp. E1747]